MPLRPGSAAARRLFKCGSADDFAHALAAYDGVVARLQKRGTARLKTLRGDDAWLRGALPNVLREQGKLDKAQLERLVRWKITRGKFRPLMGMIAGNSAAAVAAATSAAVLRLQRRDVGRADEKAALDALCALRGVGPATASVVVAALRPETCVFMADEAIEGAGVARAYTARTWLETNDRIAAKGAELGIAASDVGRALWVTAKLDVERGASGKGGAARNAPAPAAASATAQKRRAPEAKKSTSSESPRAARVSKRRRGRAGA
jgi:hypothetical protein